MFVLSMGKPITDVWLSETSSTLIQQFYPSEQGGHALADVRSGDYHPSGKLFVSFPRYVGDLPIYYDYLDSSHDSGTKYDNRHLYLATMWKSLMSPHQESTEVA
ncbi:hypothetical protein EYZ11_007379 [Aspergillus tanneri]|uniref:Glycoside hydrolase family 3 C-terminal domain-containing protein n=1 Tax=Aspergillus tanneri TaxID=1220188 RepID=A0A4S3JD46_9EURO|nr:hypothetical protein EYZ11_007379 [Aspergillus tanneri]